MDHTKIFFIYNVLDISIKLGRFGKKTGKNPGFYIKKDLKWYMCITIVPNGRQALSNTKTDYQ